MFPIARAHVKDVLLDSEDEIRRAQAALWEILRVVAEPGGATAFAALLSTQPIVRRAASVSRWCSTGAEHRPRRNFAGEGARRRRDHPISVSGE